MSALIIGIGVAVAAIGVVLTTNGLVIYQSTFGNAMATVGGIALVGGLIIVALGFIYRALLQVSEKLDGVMVHYDGEESADGFSHEAGAHSYAHHAPAQHAPDPIEAPVAAPPMYEPPRPAPMPPAGAPPLRQRPSPVSLEPAISEPVSFDPEPEPRMPEPRTPEPRMPEPRTPEPRMPEPRMPEPKSPEPREPQSLPSWFRRNREPVPPPPPVATRNFQLDDADQPAEPRPARDRHRDEAREDELPSVVRSGPFSFEPVRDEDERDREPAFEPIVPRNKPEAPEPAAYELPPRGGREPVIRETPVREPVVRPASPAAAEAAEAEPGQPPAFLRPGSQATPVAPPAPAPIPPTPAPAPAASAPAPSAPAPSGPAPSAPPAGPRAPTVLKSGFIGGMAYTLYTDGSIEAELPDGVLRFASLQELREHVAATSQGGGA